jgi:hypothetical protein
MGYMLSTNIIIEDKWRKRPNSKENGSILGVPRKGVFQFITLYENRRNHHNILFNQMIVSGDVSSLPGVISWWSLMGWTECKFCSSPSEHGRKITTWDCASSQQSLSAYAVILCSPVHPSRERTEYTDLPEIKTLFFCPFAFENIIRYGLC